MKRTIITLSLGLCIAGLSAQNAAQTATDSTATNVDTARIERRINIEKEYTPELQPATRTSIEYTVQEQNITKADIIYSGYASDVQPRPQFYPLEPIKQRILNRKTPHKGYAAVGFGYPVNWLTQFYYPILSNNENYFDIDINHDGRMLGRKHLIRTNLDLSFAHSINPSNRIYAALGYSNRYYSYYGTPASPSNAPHTITIDSLEHQSVHGLSAIVGMQSSKPMNGWEYDALINYDMTALQYIGSIQHSIIFNGLMKKAIGHNDIIVGLGLDNYFYSLPSTPAATRLNGNTTLIISPAYHRNWKSLDIHAGARLFFSFNKGTVVNAMPDIRIHYNIKQLMDIYAEITGDYQNGSLAGILEECRFWNPYTDLQNNRYTPLNALIGINIKPLKGMLFSLNAAYNYTINDHYFASPYTTDRNNNTVISNLFTADYHNTQHFKFDARLSYNYKERYTAYTQAAYYLYTAGPGTPYNHPTLEWEIGTKLAPVKNLLINANFYLGTGYTAGILTNTGTTELVKMKNHYDLNLGISYKINNTISVFADLNNLLALSPKLLYQDWYGYDNIGFNCLLGVKLEF